MGNNFEMKLNIVIDWGVDLCEIITIVLHCNGTKISETQITITKLYVGRLFWYLYNWNIGFDLHK